MRISFPRTVVAALGAAALVTATLSGCSDDKDNSATASSSTTTSAAATSAAGQADAATTKAITDAFVTFFNASTPVDQRVASVEKGQDFAAVLQGAAANPQAQGTTATVSAVKLVDATHANVTYTLLMGGNPVLPDQTGQAVKEGSAWKVAAATFCALLSLQGGASPAC
ncbi:hypothetical protein ACWDSJ_11740 [Nocardia sp. NPDC003482]